MIEPQDIYKAINDGAPWVTILYLVEQTEARGIFIRRSEFRELWADKNGVTPGPKRYRKIFTPVVGPEQNVIDTRDHLPEAPEVKRIPDLGWLGTGITSFGLNTTRKVMRESEDGPICGDRSDSY